MLSLFFFFLSWRFVARTRSADDKKQLLVTAENDIMLFVWANMQQMQEKPKPYCDFLIEKSARNFCVIRRGEGRCWPSTKRIKYLNRSD